MLNGKIALPSIAEGGINGKRSEHFGRCDSFTIVELKNGQIISDTIISNQSHEHGGCMVPVNLLAENKVNAVIVAGIGRRPLLGFDEVKIDVYVDKINDTVDKSINELINDRLNKISIDESCGGGGNCH